MFLLEIPEDRVYNSGECESQFEADVSAEQWFNLLGKNTDVPGLRHTEHGSSDLKRKISLSNEA